MFFTDKGSKNFLTWLENIAQVIFRVRRLFNRTGTFKDLDWFSSEMDWFLFGYMKRGS